MMPHLSTYDRWVRSLRPAKEPRPLDRPIMLWTESEALYDGPPARVGTIILNNRECPYTCIFCGYWRDTVEHTPGPGQVAHQVEWALGALGGVDAVKLYNCGNFFDDAAVPPADRERIAGLVRGQRLVVVECHPNLVDGRAGAFARRLDGALEVALGLEVADRQLLGVYNKKLSLPGFVRAVRRLQGDGVRTKAFIMVKPPFVAEAEAIALARRTIDFAWDAGVDTVSLIPTVATPGLMELLARRGYCAPPSLWTLHDAVVHAVGSGRGRVLVDTWDFDRLSRCDRCRERLRAAFAAVNHRQELAAVTCECREAWLRDRELDRVRGWREYLAEFGAGLRNPRRSGPAGSS